MHLRHRNSGNGYSRSGSMGMSRASTRGLSDSGRGRGYYNSDYRNLNRGFGRGYGNSKPYRQPQQLQPPRGDILMEAGRLAAEYLVSRGMLSPSVLSGKQQMGGMQEFRQREGDGVSISANGRAPAVLRLGSVVSESGSGRRRYEDDYEKTGSKNSLRERRRGNFGSFSSDWSRENGRSGSWSDRPRFSPDREDDDDDTISVHNEDHQGGKVDGSALQNSGSNKLVSKSENIGDAESEVAKLNEADVELTNTSNGLSNLNSGTKVVEEGTFDNETETQTVVTGLVIQQCAVEGDNSVNSSSGLLAFCKFAKFPTRIRSALAHKALKADAALSVANELNSDVGLNEGSDVPNDDSRIDAHPVISLEKEDLHHENSNTSFIPTYGAEKAILRSQSCPGNQSFQGKEFMHDYEQGSSQGPPGCRSSSIVEERGKKRASEESNMKEGEKKAREWIPSIVGRDDACFQVSDSGEKEVIAQEDRVLPLAKATMAVDEENLVTSPSSVEYAQEKLLFPNSYKICDLNLSETSDVNDNRNTDPIIIYPSSSETIKEEDQVDVDLPIIIDNMSGGYGRHETASEEIEVIDLENDSDLEKMTEDYNDRLMVSEFLDAFQNPVSEDINPLQNEIGLHNGEGTLGDDDSIYTSLGEIPLSKPDLGEIPLSFLQGWEQPTPDEKPF